jgi:predicted dehydrogenase
VLSTARILRRFIPPLLQSPRSELVALASRDPERAREGARRWHARRAHGSYEALLDDPEIDAVYLPLPNHLHTPWLLRCIEAGKHVLCEKPLCLSGEDVEAVAAAAARRGVHVVEAFVHLHHPQLEAMRAALPEIGPLVLLRAGYSLHISDPANIRFDPARGGGSLWDLGCYPVSLLIALLGAAPEEVIGRQVLAGSGVDQTFTGLLRFAGPEAAGRPVLAQIDCGFTTPLRETVEIIGERGTLTPRAPFRADIDGTPGGLTLCVEGRLPQELAIPRYVPFAVEIAAFEDLILDGAPPAVPLSLSAQIAYTLAALYRSARTGQPAWTIPPPAPPPT